MLPSFLSKKDNQRKTSGQDQTGQPPLEESKQPGQGTEKNKQWSIGQFWKKSKGNAGDSNSSTVSTQGSEHETPKQIAKNIEKNLEKFGSLAKNFIKGVANNIQKEFSEPGILGDPVWADYPNSKNTNNGGKSQNTDEAEEEGSDEEDFDEDYDDEDGENDDDDGEERDEEDDEEDEDEDDDEEEEEEDEEHEEEEKKEEPKEKAPQENDNFAIEDDNNFAIDDDEEETPQGPTPTGDNVASENKEAPAEAQPEIKKKKRKTKGTKKRKGTKKKRQPPQQEGVILEDVLVNKNYAFGGPFTQFHQFYFKGDYLDFEPDEFFKVNIINEKGAISNVANFIFHEKKYITIQDQIFYLTKLERVETFDLALVLESYPLSRIIRFNRMDKKKRMDIAFYTEDNNPDSQREMLIEVSNFAKLMRILENNLNSINSTYNIMRFNIE